MGPIASRINVVITTLNATIGLLFAIATVVFLWGVIKFIRSSPDDAERRKSKDILTWGIIGLTVITVAWGIVAIFINFFGIPIVPPVQQPPVEIKFQP
jgi:hypothetical protein